MHHGGEEAPERDPTHGVAAQAKSLAAEGALIRPTAESDFDAIAEITNHYILNTAIHFGYEAVTGEELRRTWREGLAVYPWFTATIDKRVVGYAKAGAWRTRPAYRWTCEVGLYLAHDARGAGLGTRLYRALIDELKVRGFHSAVGGLTLPNEASRRLHEKLGFVFVGTFHESGYKLGAWHDTGFWQLMLRDSTHRPG
jgi:L-amino acid N-acyltransferase YncA